MNTEGWKKFARLFQIIKLFENEKKCWRTKEIAERLEINEDTANDYLNDLSYAGILPVTRESRNAPWCLPEDAITPRLELSLSHAEAVSLYLAGRLLAQTQDEQNWHMTMALQKLIEALPPSLQEKQKILLELLAFEDRHQPNMSNIFQAIANGWVKRQSVRLTYAPPGKREFECLFDPYLLEPSAIGRTIYVLGYSSVSQGIRIYKLERIKRAELTNKVFDLAEDFNGVERLQQAWIVMYSEEAPVRVRLRFSSDVTSRVRETRWHPTQELTLTRDGCEWSALIGDTLEIEPWIRGWGAECEVLEPLTLRETILDHLRRSMETYGLHASTPEPRDPTIFNRGLFRQKEQEGHV